MKHLSDVNSEQIKEQLNLYFKDSDGSQIAELLIELLIEQYHQQGIKDTHIFYYLTRTILNKLED